MPTSRARSSANAAPRAWQRMLSGRRLDLLDPSPLDIEIEDIAHGLARVARWNGQTKGAHIFSVAQHSLLVEAIARRTLRRARPARRARGAAARCARIRDRRHDLAVQGGDRGRLQGGGGAAAGRDPPALRPAGDAADDDRRLIKSADRGAAYLEATRLAGFAPAEARPLLRRPNSPPRSSAITLRPGRPTSPRRAISSASPASRSEAARAAIAAFPAGFDRKNHIAAQ